MNQINFVQTLGLDGITILLIGELEEIREECCLSLVIKAKPIPPGVKQDNQQCYFFPVVVLIRWQLTK